MQIYLTVCIFNNNLLIFLLNYIYFTENLL